MTSTNNLATDLETYPTTAEPQPFGSWLFSGHFLLGTEIIPNLCDLDPVT